LKLGPARNDSDVRMPMFRHAIPLLSPQPRTTTMIGNVLSSSDDREVARAVESLVVRLLTVSPTPKDTTDSYAIRYRGHNPENSAARISLNFRCPPAVMLTSIILCDVSILCKVAHLSKYPNEKYTLFLDGHVSRKRPRSHMMALPGCGDVPLSSSLFYDSQCQRAGG
jgi:hypothetical protein